MASYIIFYVKLKVHVEKRDIGDLLDEMFRNRTRYDPSEKSPNASQ